MSTTAAVLEAELEGMSVEESKLHLQALLGNYLQWVQPRYSGRRNYKRLFDIVKRHPTLAKEHIYGNYPLFYLLTAKAPIAMIREVLHMHPDALQTGGLSGNLPLHDALVYQCGYEEVSFLVKENPHAVSTRAEFTRPRRMLPLQIHLWFLGSNNLDPEQFTRVFCLLYNAYPPHLWEDDQEWKKMLIRLLAHPKTPAELMSWLATKHSGRLVLHLTCLRGRDSKVQPLIHNLKHFVPLLNDCQELELKGWHGGGDASGALFGQLLAQVPIPSTLTIHFDSFGIHLPTNEGSLMIEGWKSCRITEMIITEFGLFMDDCHGKRLFQGLASLPNLKNLWLEKTKGYKIRCTEEIIDLLEEADLDLLVVLGACMVMDVGKLATALQKSSSTTLVEYAETNNRLALLQHESNNREIAYRSSMNRHGRAQITSSTATLDLLVHGLCSVQASIETPAAVKSSVLYGLLREAAGLWATAT